MARKAKLILSLLKWGTALLLLLLLLLDAHFELNGLPEPAVSMLRAALARRGVNCEMRTVRAGLLRGVVLSELQLRSDRAGIPIRFACMELRLRPSWGKLFRGQLDCRNASVHSGSLTLLGGAEGNAIDALRIDHLEGLLHVLRSGHLGIDLAGQVEGIQVTARGTLKNCDQLAATQPRESAPQPGVARSRRALPPQLQRVIEVIRNCDFSEQDATINLDVNADAADAAALRLRGDARLADTLVDGVAIRRFRTRFAYSGEGLDLQGISLFLSRDEQLTGKAHINLETRMFEGDFNGRLTPATVIYLSRGRLQDWPGAVSRDLPVQVHASIEPSPLAPADWSVRGSARVEDVRLRDLPIRRADLTYRYSRGICHLETIRVRPEGAEGGESLSGTLRLDLNRGLIAGNLSCSMHLPTRIAQVNPGLGRHLRDLRTGSSPVTLDLDLHESPFRWQDWHLSGTVSTAELAIRDTYCRGISGSLTLREGQLTLQDLLWSWPGTPDEFAAITLSTNLAAAVQADNLELGIHLRAQVPKDIDVEDADWQPGVDLSGTLRLRDRQYLSADFAGSLFPEALYEVLRRSFRLPRNAIAERLRCHGEPLAVVGEIPEFVLHSRRWEVLLKVAGRDATYHMLDLATAEADIRLTPKDVTFTNIRGRTTAGVDLGLDLQVRFDPLMVRIENGLVVGDPRVAESFVEPESARAIYRRLWQDVQWNPESPPRVKLPSLVYRDAPGANWRLTMESSLEAVGALYKDMQTDHIALEVTLDLPRQLRVANAVVRTAEGTVQGEVTIAFDGTPTCTFSVAETEGGIDPVYILHLINPAWDPWLEPVAVSADARIACKGSFLLEGDPMVRIEGTLRAPFAQYKELRVDDLECSWKITPGLISWDLPRGRFFAGDLQLTGLYSLETRTGQLAFSGTRMSLPEVLAHFGSGKDNLPGFISANCRLNILHGWAGKDLQLTGNGRVAISDSDLWQVPLMNGLGRLLDMTMLNRLTGGRLSSLGSITELRADLDFSGDRLLVPSLSTDGTIVSLRGNGEYSWQSSRLFFQVTGQTLRKMGVLSFALRPLSWVFNAELTGTVEEHDWRLVTAFQKAFTGDSQDGLEHLDDE